MPVTPDHVRLEVQREGHLAHVDVVHHGALGRRVEGERAAAVLDVDGVGEGGAAVQKHGGGEGEGRGGGEGKAHRGSSSGKGHAACGAWNTMTPRLEPGGVAVKLSMAKTARTIAGASASAGGARVTSAAAVENGDAVGEGRDQGQVVQHRHDRDPEPAGEVEHVRAGAGVEVVGGLVEHQQRAAPARWPGRWRRAGARRPTVRRAAGPRGARARRAPARRRPRGRARRPARGPRWGTRPRPTDSARVRRGSGASFCATAATRSARQRAGAAWSGRPSSVTRPRVGARRPAISRASVVLPAPFGPTTARRSPGPQPQRHAVDEAAAADGAATRPRRRARARPLHAPWGYPPQPARPASAPRRHVDVTT